jgi:hypothetical protein
MPGGIARICNDAAAAKTRLYVVNGVQHHASLAPKLSPARAQPQARQAPRRAGGRKLCQANSIRRYWLWWDESSRGESFSLAFVSRRRRQSVCSACPDRISASNCPHRHSWRPCTTVSSHQTPVRPGQGALTRAQEEHPTAQCAVCAVQPVDGTTQFAGGASMSAPAAWQSGLGEVDQPSLRVGFERDQRDPARDQHRAEKGLSRPPPRACAPHCNSVGRQSW